MINDPAYEHPVADPAMVSELVQAIGLTIVKTSIPDVTTTADVLSALFTTLDHALRVAREDANPTDAAYNTQEINRVLLDFLMEFGQVTKH